MNDLKMLREFKVLAQREIQSDNVILFYFFGIFNGNSYSVRKYFLNRTVATGQAMGQNPQYQLGFSCFRQTIIVQLNNIYILSYLQIEKLQNCNL